MIAPFTRQMVALRAGRTGQAAVLVVTTIAAALSLVFATVYVTHIGTGRAAVSTGADAIALSAATWEARGLNLIAALNEGIVQCLRIIRWTCVVWAALAAAACFGAGMPAFLSYSKRAARIIRSSWACAREMSRWALEVRKATPFLVLAETASLAKRLDVTGTLHPFDPRGRHDGRDTLELHVKEGPPLTLADALGPITKLRGKLKQWRKVTRAADEILGVVDRSLGAILGGDGEPVRLLEPEEDFPARQHVRFAGVGTSPPLPIPDPDWSRRERFSVEARAEPYGGGATAMTWRSRLIDERGRR